jgi:Fur family transcriptional regulator, ferric uptake regulator
LDISAEKETFTEYLRSNKLRVTQERFILFEEIMKGSGHFDADELFTQIRSKGLKTSRATVYNTLDILVECGLISKYRFGDNHSRYEKAFGRPRHDHLICLRCGEIIEFVNPRLDQMQEDICKSNNFTLQSSTLQIFGHCASCSEKGDQKG